MSMGLEITGTSLAVLGWLCTIVCCALPMWRVSAFIGSSIITAQITWEGLWMNLVPVSWSANTIIRDFYNPLVPEAQKREMGAGLYVGWAAAALQLLGGALLCCSCPPRDKYAPTKILYSAPRSTGPGTGTGTAYDRKDYV